MIFNILRLLTLVKEELEGERFFFLTFCHLLIKAEQKNMAILTTNKHLNGFIWSGFIFFFQPLVFQKERSPSAFFSSLHSFTIHFDISSISTFSSKKHAIFASAPWRWRPPFPSPTKDRLCCEGEQWRQCSRRALLKVTLTDTDTAANPLWWLIWKRWPDIRLIQSIHLSVFTREGRKRGPGCCGVSVTEWVCLRRLVREINSWVHLCHWVPLNLDTA